MVNLLTYKFQIIKKTIFFIAILLLNLFLSQIQLLMQAKKILKFEKEEVVEDKQRQQVFNFAKLKQNLDITIVKNTDELLEMELQGINASIANGLRRIIMAEISTMAFHQVKLYQNTSVIPDQLLVHRLGLLPLKIDPNLFEVRNENQDLNSENSLKFELKVTCRRKKQFQKFSEEDLADKTPQEYLENCNIYSKELKWIPQGNQATKFERIKLVHDKIIIAKLRQNQQIYLQIYAEKGIGKKHAKWSPVSTCFYRLMPNIVIEPTFNHQKYADGLIGCCPASVFQKKKGKAVVVRQRDCTTCRECINLEGVSLGKVKDHFIFTIESTGIFTAEDIFLRALKVLEDKAKSYII